MSLEAGTFLLDVVAANPTVNDPVSQGDDHMRLLKTVLRNTFPNATRAFYFPSVPTAKVFADTPVTVAATDQDALFLANAVGGAIVFNLPLASTVPSGFTVAFKKTDAGVNTVTIDGNGSETIDGALTYVLGTQYDYVKLRTNGTTWYVVGITDFTALNATSIVFTPSGNIAAINVATALAELDTEKAKVTQTTEPFYGVILGALSNRDYRIVLKATEGGTITETTTRSVSGTATATFKINTTALGGTANAVSSSEQSQAQASNNVFVAGDDIVITISANASCIDMSFSIKWTRTLL